MVKWIRTSRLSIKNSDLSVQVLTAEGLARATTSTVLASRSCSSSQTALTVSYVFSRLVVGGWELRPCALEIKAVNRVLLFALWQSTGSYADTWLKLWVSWSWVTVFRVSGYRVEGSVFGVQGAGSSASRSCSSSHTALTVSYVFSRLVVGGWGLSPQSEYPSYPLGGELRTALPTTMRLWVSWSWVTVFGV